MKKKITNLLVLLFLVSLTSCKQLVAGLEDAFSHWTNNAKIMEIEFPEGLPHDGEGVLSLPSDNDAHVYFKLHNPKNFEFFMPGNSDAPKDIIIFGEDVRGKNGGIPEPETDYSLVQPEPGKIRLEYKKEFLRKNEHGKVNLIPKINLYDKMSKRKFEQSYAYNIRANTVPPAPAFFTAGKIQKAGDWYYVLIFKFEGIKDFAEGSVLLHQDIAELEFNEGESTKNLYPIKLTTEGFDVSGVPAIFVPPTQEITSLQNADVQGGNAGIYPTIPGADDRKWMLCIKTGAKVTEALSYRLSLKDLKGLISPEASGITNKAKLPIPKIKYEPSMGEINVSGVYIDNQNALTPSASSSGNPVIISSCFDKKVILEAYNEEYPSDVRISAEVKLSDSTSPPSGYAGGKGSIQPAGNTSKILLDSIPRVDEIYEVRLKAESPNFSESDEKTYYYKVRKEVRTGHSSWHILKTAVANAKENDTVYINGIILSTNDVGDNGEIEVNKNINIRGLTGKTHDIIDAQSNNHRIFEVAENKSLTLTKLTLQNGKRTGSTAFDTGGAIKAGNGSVLTLDDADIKDSEAVTGGGAISTGGTLNIQSDSVISRNKTTGSGGLGGAIYLTGSGTLVMTGGTIENNTAALGGAVYNGGIFEISGAAKISVDSSKNDVYLAAPGRLIKVKGALTQSRVARIRPADHIYAEDRKVVEGEGFTLPDNYVSKFDLTSKSGENWVIQKHLSQNALVLKRQSTEITTWKQLQDAATAANPGDTIVVKNNLTADGTTSEIAITKNLTIRGEGSSVTLDANEKHRIFKVSGGATLKLENITLQKGLSKGESGGGISVEGGSLEMNRVTIQECKTPMANKGGAIYIKNTSGSGSLLIKGLSKIEYNQAEKGAGIYIETSSGNNIIEGSTEIKGNTCLSNGQGGGIYLQKGNLVLQGDAKILNNESRIGNYGGGGIYILPDGILTIKDSCLIEANKAKNSEGSAFTGFGGGIYNSGTLTMEGGEIKDNEAAKGGGVYNNGTFKISGSANITFDSSKNDIYLPANKVIMVSGNLTETFAARISPESYPASPGQTITVLAADPGVVLSAQVSKFKVTNSPDGKKWKINNSGQLEEVTPGGKTVTSWSELKSEVEKTSGGAEVIIVDGTETDLTATGPADEIIVKRNVSIIGKNTGITLNANKQCRILKVSNNATLTLKDIILKEGKADSGSGIYVEEASLEIENVTIKECKSKTGTGMGGAIYINNLSHNGRLWIKGNSKIETNGSYQGAGIFINTTAGENIIEGKTKITGNNCFISGKGGGIYINQGSLVLKGEVEISNNESKNDDTNGGGGGAYISATGSLTIKDSCEIKNNKAKKNSSDAITGHGGGVCNLGTLIMEGGTMTENEAKEGGAVYNNGSFTMSGSAKISPSSGAEDEHKKGKNDVYLNNHKVINVIDTLAAGNNQAARITVHKSNYLPGERVLTGNTSANASKFKITKKGSEEWEVGPDGYLKQK